MADVLLSECSSCCGELRDSLELTGDYDSVETQLKIYKYVEPSSISKATYI